MNRVGLCERREGLPVAGEPPPVLADGLGRLAGKVFGGVFRIEKLPHALPGLAFGEVNAPAFQPVIGDLSQLHSQTRCRPLPGLSGKAYQTMSNYGQVNRGMFTKETPYFTGVSRRKRKFWSGRDDRI